MSDQGGVASDSHLLASQKKEEGNELFRNRRYEEALACYDEAIRLDPDGSHVYYSNRSSCLAALGRWAESAADAEKSISLADQAGEVFLKGYFRLAKAQAELGHYERALACIGRGLKIDKANVELRRLEKQIEERREKEAAELTSIKDSRARPKYADFQTVRGLGQGNFTTVLEVQHRRTQEVFALKVIEKEQVERLKKRHPNIYNEINMERRVLVKARGHPNIIELYHSFQDYTALYLLLENCTQGEVWSKLQLGDVPVGVACSVARFYTREVVSGLEWLHGRGIVHRDLKPENLVLSGDGRVKLIDLGSAKDLVETDLNGPEFVGTAEYMSPEAMHARDAGKEAFRDLWALGNCVYQFLTGVVPFKAASAYLIFMRAKRCNPRYPRVIPPDARDLISRLLRLAPHDRLGSEKATDPACRGYSALWAHPFLVAKGDDATTDQVIQSPSSLADDCVISLAQQCVQWAKRPSTDSQYASAVESLGSLPSLQHARLLHILERQGRLSEPRIYRLFGTTPRAACRLRMDHHSREALGLGQAQHGTYNGPFFFLHLSCSLSTTKGRGREHLDALTKAIAAANRLRPRFVVVSGDWTTGPPSQNQQHLEQAEALWCVLSRLSESLPLLLVPDPATAPPPDVYHQDTGADYYGLWYGGVRCLVVNNMAQASAADAQEEWLVEELEQGRHSSQHIIVLSHTPYFGQHAPAPPSARLAKWLTAKIHGRESRVRAILSGSDMAKGEIYKVPTPPGKAQDTDDEKEKEEEGKVSPDGEEDKEDEEESDSDDEQVPILQCTHSGACIVKVYRENVEVTFTALDELPGKIELKTEPTESIET